MSPLAPAGTPTKRNGRLPNGFTEHVLQYFAVCYHQATGFWPYTSQRQGASLIAEKYNALKEQKGRPTLAQFKAAIDCYFRAHPDDWRIREYGYNLAGLLRYMWDELTSGDSSRHQWYLDYWQEHEHYDQSPHVPPLRPLRGPRRVDEEDVQRVLTFFGRPVDYLSGRDENDVQRQIDLRIVVSLLRRYSLAELIASMDVFTRGDLWESRHVEKYGLTLRTYVKMLPVLHHRHGGMIRFLTARYHEIVHKFPTHREPGYQKVYSRLLREAGPITHCIVCTAPIPSLDKASFGLCTSCAAIRSPRCAQCGEALGLNMWTMDEQGRLCNRCQQTPSMAAC